MDNKQNLQFLIADDDAANRLVLQKLLQLQGFSVITATNGLEAVELYEKEDPALVLMDIKMPKMDGYEAASRIKSISNSRDEFVPIIFLTATTTEDGLAKCIESGGDDFLTKPYSNLLLRARIDALMRIRHLYRTVQKQREELISHQGRMERERQLAKRVFSNILDAGTLDLPIIKSLISPLSLFSGDIILVAPRPSGGIHVLLGDFSGHGLAAATGALPASSVFYRMTAKGFSVSEIVTEINAKLISILPEGMFLAACVISLDPMSHTMTVWNGGIPPIIVYNNSDKGQNLKRIDSKHLPLGIADEARFNRRIEVISMNQGDRVYITSDGVTETTNSQGELFGYHRLENILKENDDPEGFFDIICESLKEFQGGGGQKDDVAFIEIEYNQNFLEGTINMDSDREVFQTVPASTWNFSMELGPDLIRHYDPLPTLMQSLSDIQGFSGRKQELFTILSELFANALDHGILELDSEMKNTVDGFTHYYQERAKRLSNLSEGNIRIDITHKPVETGGELIVKFEDSGNGFDFEKKLLKLEDNTTSSGRGIQLIRSRCHDVSFEGNGNIVKVVYRWEE